MKIVLIKRVNFKYASKKKLYLLVNTSISLLIPIETNFYMKNYGYKYIRVCFIRDDRISIVFLRFDETFSEQLIDYPCFEIFEIANIFQIVLSNIYLSIVTIYCILFPRWLPFILSLPFDITSLFQIWKSRIVTHRSNISWIKNPVSVKIVKHIPRGRHQSLWSLAKVIYENEGGTRVEWKEGRKRHDSSITPPRVS